MNTPLKMRYHRKLPKEYKLSQITITKNHNKYYIALSLTYENRVILMSNEDLDIKTALGIDLNINEIALSNRKLIPTHYLRF